MRLPELVRTTAFRWAAAVAAAFAILSLVLFAFVYWQTAGFERAQIDRELLHEINFIASGPPEAAVERLKTWLQEDLHSVRYALLTNPRSSSQSGNIEAPPAGLALDGHPREVATNAFAVDADSDERREVVRAVGVKLADGRTLVVAHDTDELEHIRATITRALALGLVPMVVMALGGGALLGRRALARVATLDSALGTVMRGRLSGRLPVTGRADEFDRLATGVNAMLDEIERLLEEVRGVGDSIAHDLRTPLTRARARLERSRTTVRTPEEFAEAIDETLSWLDQTFAVITAVLRIGEIEHGRRRAAFERVPLGPILSEAVELYEPLAEERNLLLRADVRAEEAATFGDRDLLFEAVANLVDNALKFTPSGGQVTLSLDRKGSDTILAVADDGPGIPALERDRVFKRFHRAERSRHLEGNGLGLALVSAVAQLHGFGLAVADNYPGCRVELTCPALSDGAEAAG